MSKRYDIDWERLLDSLRIEFVTSGPNVARDNINVKCPWCGHADPSHHLGISLLDQGWACWREDSHRGRSPVKLVAALLGRPWRAVEELLEEWAPERDDADSLLAMLEAPPAQPRTVEPIEQPPTFKSLRLKGGEPYLAYLRARGFRQPKRVAKRFGLFRDTRSAWAHRIIAPIYRHGEMVAWTGRAITNAELRYRIHPSGDAAASAIYGEEFAPGGHTLFVVEGPVDAWKLNWVLRDTDSAAVAMLSTGTSPQRVAHLGWIMARYERTVFWFDAEAMGPALGLQARVAVYGQTGVTWGVEGLDDPGELPERGGLEAVSGALKRDLGDATLAFSVG